MDAHRPCPDSALLAAFLDGALPEYERTAVVSHLAECEQCRAAALTVIEFREVQTLDEIWRAEGEGKDLRVPKARERRSWHPKTRAPALAMASVAALALLAVGLYPSFRQWSAQQAIRSLVEAAGTQRPTESRLSGGFRYGAPPDIEQPDPVRASTRLVTAAEDVRASYKSDYGAASRRALGIAAIITSNLDEAIDDLSIAAAADPRDGQLANDLAAAYYERAQRLDRPEDLPAALSAVERALQLDPKSLEAWFNRALIMTAFGFRGEARAAWREYVEHDANSVWAQEARQRLKAIPDAGPSQSDWDAVSGQLLRAVNAQPAATAVHRSSSRAREFFVSTLLRDVAAQIEARKDPSPIRAMRFLADALERSTGDAFFADATTRFEQLAASPRTRSTAARAHAQFVSAMARFAERAPKAAAELQKASTLLTEIGSPLALLADIERATLALGDGAYGQAADAARAAKERALSSRYLHAVARAAWIEGIAEFNRNNLAAARFAYEQMLDAAIATGDAEHYVMATVILANLHEVLGDNNRAWKYRTLGAARLDDCYTLGTRVNYLLSAAAQSLTAGHWVAALVFQSRLLNPALVLAADLEVQTRTQHALTLLRLGNREAARAELQKARARSIELTELSKARPRIEADLLVLESELLQPDNPVAALATARQAAERLGPAGDDFRRGRVYLRVAAAALAAGLPDEASSSIDRAVASLQAYRKETPATSQTRASDYDLTLYAKAIEIALRRGDVARAFEYSERRRARLTPDHPAALSLPEFQRTLAADAGVVVINQLADTLHVWVIRRDGVVTHSTKLADARAAALITAHLEEVSQGSERPRMSGELFELLLRPVAAQLQQVRTLNVVADAPYHQVAFAGLWDSRRDRYLVEDFRLVSAPRMMLRGAEPMVPPSTPPASRRIGIIQASNTVGDPATRGETMARDLRTVYGAETAVRRGEAATTNEFLRQIAERDVVHLAVPIVGTGDDLAQWRVLVSDYPGRKYSGALPYAEIAAAANARARVVALEPAFERRDYQADGSEALARALLAAGVPAVVAPIAMVPGASLDQTWLEFHRQYAAGSTAAESLRRAQLAALERSQRRPGPWATLTVFSATE